MSALMGNDPEKVSNMQKTHTTITMAAKLFFLLAVQKCSFCIFHCTPQLCGFAASLAFSSERSESDVDTYDTMDTQGNVDNYATMATLGMYMH